MNEGAPGAKTKEDRVDRYIARLERVAFSTNERGERRGLELLEKRFLDANTLTYEEIPESYWKNQEQIERSRGKGGDLAQASADQLEQARASPKICVQFWRQWCIWRLCLYAE